MESSREASCYPSAPFSVPFSDVARPNTSNKPPFDLAALGSDSDSDDSDSDDMELQPDLSLLKLDLPPEPPSRFVKINDLRNVNPLSSMHNLPVYSVHGTNLAPIPTNDSLFTEKERGLRLKLAAIKFLIESTDTNLEEIRTAVNEGTPIYSNYHFTRDMHEQKCIILFRSTPSSVYDEIKNWVKQEVGLKKIEYDRQALELTSLEIAKFACMNNINIDGEQILKLAVQKVSKPVRMNGENTDSFEYIKIIRDILINANTQMKLKTFILLMATFFRSESDR